jgi:hypothetical protein
MNAHGPHGGAPKPARRRDWRRIHHSPLFWVGLFLCLGAITIYVLSEDLSSRPAENASPAKVDRSSPSRNAETASLEKST